MTDDKDLRFRTRALRVWAWLLARPALLWVAAGLLTGLLLPHVARWLVG